MAEFLYRRAEGLFYATGQVFILFLRGLIECPSLVRGWRRFAIQLGRVGTDSLPLALMIGLFTGMVVALQTGIELKENFGAEEFVGAIIGVTLVREMGPVITAFILAGRVGSSIAAELGTMSVSEEVDALRSMGISPVRYLFVPRLFALLIMQPILTVFSVLMGIWGGGLIISSYLGFPIEIYFHRVHEAVDLQDIIHGFSKTFVFAALIATISTRMGLAATRGAEGVGKATTSAVVASLTMILIFDYLLGRFIG
jgi:phospholipid/cholesterol/gamma-HCH transport system permease protein